jgi:hypothetical protein
MAVTKQKPVTPDELQELNDTLRDFAGDESEQGRREYARIRARLKRVSHDEIHPNEELVVLDVPKDAQGFPFAINGKTYEGTVTVPACEASTLLHMIDQNRQEQLRHTQEAGRNVFLGQLGDRARTVQE